MQRIKAKKVQRNTSPGCTDIPLAPVFTPYPREKKPFSMPQCCGGEASLEVLHVTVKGILLGVWDLHIPSLALQHVCLPGSYSLKVTK